MAIGDVYQLSVRMSLSGQVYMNGLAFERTLLAEPAAADFTSLANAVKVIHQAAQADSLSYTTWVARQVRGENVEYPTGENCEPVGGNYFDGNLTGTLVGGQSGELLPHQCALVTTLRTGQIGRRKRGRFYAPGWLEVSQTNGLFNNSLVTSIDTAWAAFLAVYTVTAPISGFRLGIWSVREATGCGINPATGEHERIDDPNPAGAFTPVSQHIVRQPVFTQRRRRIGVGM